MTTGPAREFRVGGVRATIWENTRTREDGTIFTTQTCNIERRYKSGEEWKSSNAYNLAQLQKLRLAINAAEEYMLVGESEDEVDTDS